jgi:hypothetical protein
MGTDMPRWCAARQSISLRAEGLTTGRITACEDSSAHFACRPLKRRKRCNGGDASPARHVGRPAMSEPSEWRVGEWSRPDMVEPRAVVNLIDRSHHLQAYRQRAADLIGFRPAHRVGSKEEPQPGPGRTGTLTAILHHLASQQTRHPCEGAAVLTDVGLICCRFHGRSRTAEAKRDGGSGLALARQYRLDGGSISRMRTLPQPPRTGLRAGGRS